MSENAVKKDQSIPRIETIGTQRDALRATVAALAARESYEETIEVMGSAQARSPVENALKTLTLSTAEKAWTDAVKTLEAAKNDFQAAARICPLPEAAETQIEGHVMREAAVAERSLKSILAERGDPRAEQPLDEIIENVLAQQPIAETKTISPTFTSRIGAGGGGKAILGGY